jgi:hypothetical protein
MALVFLLKIAEEKSLVLFDRSAQREAELIEIEFFGARGEERTGIEIGIAQKLEDTPVQLVASRFCRNQNRGPAACSKLRRVVVGKYFELLDRVDG